MSYEERVTRAIHNKDEQAIVSLIEEDIPASETTVRAKEQAIGGLAQLYVDKNTPEKIKSIA